MNLRILAVSGSEEIRRFYEDAFEQLSQEPQIVSSITEAEQLIGNSNYNLDFLLCQRSVEREKDGYEFLRRVKKNPEIARRFSNTYIVGTGLFVNDEKEYLGLDDYIERPVLVFLANALLKAIDKKTQN